MSLVSGYPPQPYPSGPIGTHDFYAYHQTGRYPEHPGAASTMDGAAYFQNWMLNSQTQHHADLGMNTVDAPYGLPGPGPMPNHGDYNNMSMFGFMDSNNVGRPRGQKRRGTANRKERRRTVSINTAFSNLRGCIPNVPSDTKLSKIKTLRLATSYIAYLMDILNKDDPKLTEGGFKAEVTKKIESREEKRKREAEEILRSTTNPDKKPKGRTGWPQHVWASELGGEGANGEQPPESCGSTPPPSTPTSTSSS